MATLMLDDDEFKSLEHIVSRLSQLSSSIQSLRIDILKSNPLPHPSSLQASAQIIQRNLQSLLDSISENSDLLNRLAVRPSPNFPGRTQENALGQLLRKKLEPDVEELVAKGREAAVAATPEGLARMQEVWDDALRWVQQRIAQYVAEEAGDVYTKEEREMGVENVRTGLRRDLDEDEEDEDEDEDEGAGGEGEGEGDGDDNNQKKEGREKREKRGPEPETLLWFAARGDFAVPPNVEYERKQDAYRGLQGVSVPP
ncbi:Mediator of RNA polymerase II transcription subunit-like protein [Hapsidospora chrysogenum ATCC 11550]|uniref:Mediator of RNA polymerase II transcription subunit 8 n=1 Tax=Hapsidospora chrysogenum (strain ATCC 11550 / CBS 779.69 / DSM 880 / IAM 14645 / JCM 23072 / IMI 49137) TaxID=857340 RepID=A0A086TAV4_HAPC1|nr:Mediator of RNA polymerase II transcription subunit-like protein [Hapsidospora chrysogenum ATCC 11550]